MGLFEMLFLGGGNSPYQFTGADRVQLVRLEKKIDLILKHLGLDYLQETSSGGLSPEVQDLARDPRRKIEAIKLHREQTGVGLKEAKDAVEAFMYSGQ
jgi:Ribosomal protein L7/L12 C-terminal domain